MFETADILVFAAASGVLSAAFCYAYPWARRNARFVLAGVATFAGAAAWNFVISHTRASGLDVDAPVIALSWQDVGSGVLAFATTSLVLSITNREEPALKVMLAAGIAGVVTMVFDIFVL